MNTETKENIRLIDTLLENEKKSMTLTTLTIIGFCLLAGFIIYQSSQLSKAKKQLQIELNEKNTLLNTLDSALTLLDNLQDSLVNTNNLLLNTLSDTDVSPSYNGSYNNRYKCYIQYMPGFEQEAKKAYSELIKKDWYGNFIAENEKIEDQSFNSYVKYFDKNDEELAYKMHKTLLNANIPLDREPVLVEIARASKKFEIWLGKVKPQNVKDILNKPRYKILQKQNLRKN